MSLKILHIDIETTPLIAYTWGIWKQNIGLNQIEEDWHIISWAAGWEGEDVIMGSSLPMYDEYRAEPENDKYLLEELWKLLDDADVVVGHNAAGFDVPKINTRFLFHGITPPSPFKIVDTLKVAKQHFKFTSNKLDFINKFFGYSGKMEHEGMELWLGCMKGDMGCWERMLEYNMQDIEVLKEVYTRLKPYITNHPHIYRDGCCTICGSDDVIKKGLIYTPTSAFQRYLCKNCGKWSRAAVSETSTDDRRGQLRNAL